jgi:hypothetical protein
MITKEQADAILKKKKKLSFEQENFSQFSPQYQTLGKIISHKYIRHNMATVSMSNIKRYESVYGTEHDFNPWLSEEGEKLALLLFGKTNALYIAKMWELFKSLPYQSGYYRRSFRVSESNLYVVNALSALRNLCDAGSKGFADCSFVEQARLTTHYSYYSLSYLFSVVLDEGNSELRQVLADIIDGEDEVGAVSRDIIKGLLLTNNKSDWQLVERLLLAAQRQEGLRQSILECLDETSVGALRYFIGVILEHDLMRFSSVIRAIDVWFGYGWEAPKKATIKRVLEFAVNFIDETENLTLPIWEKSMPVGILQALKSKDHLETYTALWALGLKDVKLANNSAISLVLDNALSKDKKLLSLYFMSETNLSNPDLAVYMKKHWGTDIELDYWMLKNASAFEWTYDFFERVKQSADNLPTAGKKMGGSVFYWLYYNIKADDFYQALIENADQEQCKLLASGLTKIPSQSREKFIQKVFPKHYCYSLHESFYKNKSKDIPLLNLSKEHWQRTLIHDAISDRNASVVATAMNCFCHMSVDDDEVHLLIDLLSRKSKDLRTNIIGLLLRQPEKTLTHCVDILLAATKEAQRLAGLEILSLLAEQGHIPAYVSEQVEIYQNRKSFSKNEEVFLAKFSQQEQGSTEHTFANGFGAIDYTKLRPMLIPQKTLEAKFSLSNLLKAKPTAFIGSLLDEEKVTFQINNLIAIFAINRHFEYQYEGYEGAKETAILGDTFQELVLNHQNYSAKERLNNLPLSDVWQTWYQQSDLSDVELFYAHLYLNAYQDPFEYLGEMKGFIQSYYPDLSAIDIGEARSFNSVNHSIARVLNALMEAHCDHIALAQFKVSIFEDMLARCPNKLKSTVLNQGTYLNARSLWFDVITQSGFASIDSSADILIQNQPELVQRFYDLCFYVFAQSVEFPMPIEDIQTLTKKKYKSYKFHGFEQSIALFNNALLPAENLVFQALYDKQLFRILDGGVPHKRIKPLRVDPAITVMQDLKTNLLKLELERGDLPSEATEYIGSFVKVEGLSYLFVVLTRLGKENLDRGYGYDSNSKKYTFSNILSRCIAKKSDTFEYFCEQAKQAQISNSRLIQVACYAPQWTDWIGQYLKIKDLPAAIWWFHAHATDYMNAEKETQIARYSNISRHDFQNGAIDIDWFNRVYNNLGKANWKLLHDSAKYASDGNGHRQVKLYSSVMLGEVKITATIKKVEEKRDKDYLRSLGLIPLSKTVAEKDLLKRYDLIQRFLKESNQFGAQRQESEKIACGIALDNLARNSGYEDRTRFEWAMEGKATENIMENSTAKFDDAIITLNIDDQGKPEIIVLKGEKIQKSIPAKYKKDKQILRIKESKSYLTKQYSRTRASLEQAMLGEDAFSKQELQKIMLHPVVKAMLSKLVLFNVTTQALGFYSNGKLVDTEGKHHIIQDNHTLLIAHAHHLYTCGLWTDYQKHLFEQQIQQPFKQVFRELYVITADEKERSFRSERYQGHQVQPAKTVSLLRTRGWTVSYEDGLQRVFHKLGFMATMYAQADWFSPADVEAPTLEYVCFHSLKDYKAMPMEEISAIVFSEVMRDVDLVVSVAHVGGVDPEASHSTMQMRGLLAEESARMFKLSNVQVKERYVLIQGKLGEYSIHLGSANVMKKGLAINIIAVQSQHRGRVFLPFVDDDPKSAELISKMKLLAEDHKIKDPTVLAQINK